MQNNHLTHRTNKHQMYIIFTIKFARSRSDLTQNLSTPGYGVVHSEAPTKDLWRVVEEKQLIHICKKSAYYNNSKLFLLQ